MARPRKPTATLELTGAYKKNSQRRHEFEPKPGDGPGEPPLTMDFDQQEIWREIINQCEPGVFGPSDRMALEIVTKLFWEFRFKYDDFTAAKLNRLETFLARFGMTPADRSRVAVPTKPKRSIYEELDDEPLAGEIRPAH